MDSLDAPSQVGADVSAFDNPVIALMGELAQCLCATIASEGLPPVCFCGIVPGEVPSLDYVNSCDEACGMAWVRMAGAGMVSSINNESVQKNNCDGTLGWDMEVGMIRCSPVGDEQGNAPEQDEWLASADLQLADMVAMKKAIMCCPSFKYFVLTTYTPIGPQGGAVGGFWIVGTQDVQ